MFQNWFVVCDKMHQAFTISNFILIYNRRLILVKYSFVVDSFVESSSASKKLEASKSRLVNVNMPTTSLLIIS